MRFGSLAPYIPWRSRPFPIDWNAEFGREAPLKVEIGFGNGEHLVKRAKEDPNSNHLGIEMTWGSVWRVLRTTHREQIPNIRALWEDANASVLWNFAQGSVDEFLGLFPCPWPKRKHAKFRLFQPEFLRRCNSRLKDGGCLIVVTDDANYRDQMLKEITLEATGMTTTWETIPASFGTKYERKWQEGGQQEFYRLVFQKTVHQTIANPETLELTFHTVPSFDPDKFAPQDEKEPNGISFKNFLYDPKREVAMQEVYTTEAGLEQQFWIRIRHQDNGWKIGISAAQNLLPVASVQRTLDIVRDACLS